MYDDWRSMCKCLGDLGSGKRLLIACPAAGYFGGVTGPASSKVPISGKRVCVDEGAKKRKGETMRRGTVLISLWAVKSYDHAIMGTTLLHISPFSL